MLIRTSYQASIGLQRKYCPPINASVNSSQYNCCLSLSLPLSFTHCSWYECTIYSSITGAYHLEVSCEIIFRYFSAWWGVSYRQRNSLIHANCICFSHLLLFNLETLLRIDFSTVISTWIHSLTHTDTHTYIDLFICLFALPSVTSSSSSSSCLSVALLSPFNAVRKLLKTNKGWSQQDAKVLSGREINAINSGKEREREKQREEYLLSYLLTIIRNVWSL